MKNLLNITLLITLIFAVACNGISGNKESDKAQVVEASCGTCNFGLKGDDCALAVKIEGKAYFVDGTSIDDHGDAHAKDGFCESVRKAEVRGEVQNGRYKATYFKLLAK